MTQSIRNLLLYESISVFMIPKIIHYCWFGHGEKPDLVLECIESWRQNMPDWQFMLWNEDNFDVSSVPYVREAYEARKFAFVSDYVRLVALQTVGGIYLDTDVEVFRPLDDLLTYKAFAGYEGSKHCPIGTCIIGSEAEGQWVSEQLALYEGRPFVLADGSMDMETNTSFITRHMVANGFVCDGQEKEYEDLHVFPVEYFSPRHTTGDYIRTEHTYCDHRGLCSWSKNNAKGLKAFILRLAGPKISIRLIKLKRKLLG